MTVGIIVGTILLLIQAETAPAEPVPWAVADGGNGHLYEAVVVADRISWEDARTAAQAAGGDLASITSAAENVFVEGLLAANPLLFWGVQSVQSGPWIGAAASSNSAGDWAWVSGEPFTFTDWGPNEPFRNGDRISYALFSGSTIGWNDIPSIHSLGPKSYLVEIVPLSLCGDGNVDLGEECDDGNSNDGDGCDSACRVEPECRADGDCDDGRECTADSCVGIGCKNTPVENGALCNAAAGCCQGGECLVGCAGVVPPARQQKKKVTVTCTGQKGDVCAGQGFVSVEVAPRSGSQVAIAAQTEEVRVTKRVRKKIGGNGTAKLKLRLNRVGRRLLKKAIRQGQSGIDVRVQVQLEGDPQLLDFLVRVVKGRRR